MPWPWSGVEDKMMRYSSSDSLVRKRSLVVHGLAWRGSKSLALGSGKRRSDASSISDFADGVMQLFHGDGKTRIRGLSEKIKSKSIHVPGT